MCVAGIDKSESPGALPTEALETEPPTAAGAAPVSARGAGYVADTLLSAACPRS